MIGGAIAQTLGYRPLFAIALLMALCALLVALRFLRDAKTAAPREAFRPLGPGLAFSPRHGAGPLHVPRWAGHLGGGSHGWRLLASSLGASFGSAALAGAIGPGAFFPAVVLGRGPHGQGRQKQ